MKKFSVLAILASLFFSAGNSFANENAQDNTSVNQERDGN